LNDSYPVEIRVAVRFRDTDAMGHVNNAVYSSYLEEARVAYWRRLTGLEDFTKVDLILARVEIDYRSPAFVEDELEIKIRLPRVGGSSFDFEYRVEERRSGRLVAQARSVQCLYDYKNARIKRIPPELKEKISRLEGGS
jgi:acyl-CoA thioester hydrolase